MPWLSLRWKAVLQPCSTLSKPTLPACFHWLASLSATQLPFVPQRSHRRKSLEVTGNPDWKNSANENRVIIEGAWEDNHRKGSNEWPRSCCAMQGRVIHARIWYIQIVLPLGGHFYLFLNWFFLFKVELLPFLRIVSCMHYILPWVHDLYMCAYTISSEGTLTWIWK